MRIVFYYFATGQFSQLWIHHHYEDELRRAGHNITTINPWDRGRGLDRAEYDQFLLERVVEEHKREPIALVVTSVRQNEIGAEVVRLIRQRGIRVVNKTHDNILAPHRLKRIASAFDLCWVHEPEAIPTLKGYGARVFHEPVAANPHVFFPSPVAEDVDASFCGQRYGVRIVRAEELFRRGIPVELYGVGWSRAAETAESGDRRALRPQGRMPLGPAVRHVAASLTHRHGRRWVWSTILRRLRRRRIDPEIVAAMERHGHPPPPFPEMVELFSRSKVSLGFNELGHTYVLKQPLLQVRLHDFEAPASGACYITSRMPILQEHFEEDREMLFYSDVEELADKIRFYLDPRRDSIRAEIKQRARARVVRDHTWMHRFSKLFKELDLT